MSSVNYEIVKMKINLKTPCFLGILMIHYLCKHVDRIERERELSLNSCYRAVRKKRKTE